MQRNTSTHIHDKDNLIAADKVEGTDLFASNGDKLGTVRKVMIDKQSGTVSHALVGYGGLLGMGEDFYPVPWDALDYDKRKGGYVCSGIDQTRIKQGDAPRFQRNQEPDWNENYQRTIRAYYFPNG